MNEDVGRVQQAEPGSRASTEPANGLGPAGFDPSRVRWVASSLSGSGRRNLNALPVSGGWATVSEMKPDATGSGMTLLFVGWAPRLCEREWTRWGGEFGQKRGEGYQYRITPFGREVRKALRDSNSDPQGENGEAG